MTYRHLSPPSGLFPDFQGLAAWKLHFSDCLLVGLRFSGGRAWELEREREEMIALAVVGGHQRTAEMRFGQQLSGSHRNLGQMGITEKGCN